MNNENSKMSVDELKEFIDEMATNESNHPLFPDGWEGGLIGYNIDDNGDVQAVFSIEKCLDYFATNHIKEYESYEEAYQVGDEHFHYNLVRSLPYIEKINRPIFIHTFD